MKTYCKNVDISSPALIAQGIRNCIENDSSRHGLLAYFAKLAGMTVRAVRTAIETKGAEYDAMIARAADKMAVSLAARDVTLRPIRYREVVDKSCGKVRRIGMQSIRACILDHVAVVALSDALRRIGEFQVAGIPDKGPLYGAQHVARWLADPSQRYYVKMDIRKCYESVSIPRLLAYINRLTKNEGVRWLVRTLLATHGKGLSVGSYLSQWLCNLYLSRAYHFVSEQLARVRVRKDGTQQRVRLVQHTLFYADDILLLGKNRRDVWRAAEALTVFLRAELGLYVKPWQLCDVDRVQGGKRGFIDMMGYRCHRGWLTIRRRVWRRAHRSLCRISTQWAKNGRPSLSAARKMGAYFGYIKHTASDYILRSYNEDAVMRVSGERIAAAA